MSILEILSQHPTPEQIAASDRRMLAEADDRWRRSLCKAAGLPEPFSPKFSKRLAATYKHNLKFWGKFFQRAIETGAKDA